MTEVACTCYVLLRSDSNLPVRFEISTNHAKPRVKDGTIIQNIIVASGPFESIILPETIRAIMVVNALST